MCNCREVDLAAAIAICRRGELLGKAWLGAVLIGFVGSLTNILQHNDMPSRQHTLSVCDTAHTTIQEDVTLPKLAAEMMFVCAEQRPNLAFCSPGHRLLTAC